MTFPTITSLDGEWQLLPTDSFRQGFYPLEDDVWLTQELPAHWQQHPLLERYAGKMVYRKRFPLSVVTGPSSVAVYDHAQATDKGQRTTDSARWWLRLNGIFYWSQPYFNGVDLGRHEGYFAAQEHEVTGWVAAENTLVVEVECPDEHDKVGKRMITGVFSHWDCIDPATNPGGSWLPIELIATGPTRIQEVLLHTETISPATAELRFRATLDAARAADVTLRWTLTPKNFAGEIQVIEQRRALAQGQQELAGLLEVRDPQPWWTHDLGHPNCYTVALDVVQEGAVSDCYTSTFGIRQFELRDWIAHLNGVRLLIKGNNYAPGDTRIATITPDRCAQDMRLAQECHFNMLRIHAHVDHPALYEAADQAGILLWQDFPLQWLYCRAVLPHARRQVRQMVHMLYNHPAVVLWCMHNESFYIADTKDDRLLTRARTYASVVFWNWNRDVLDIQIKQIAEKADRTRPVVRSSGEFAIPLLHKGTDTHFYHGWYTVYGELHHWEPIARHLPNTIRFVTEFGAQSFPNLESSVKFMNPDIATIEWGYLVERHHFQEHMLGRWLDWRGAQSLEELILLTQEYQIALNRFYIDRLRYHKYRPTGGIIPFMFHDPNPAVTWSILDYWRVPKRSYEAMRLAFSPQYIFTLVAQRPHAVGDSIDLPVYIVNDAHQPVPVDLTARLGGPGGVELAKVERSLTLPPDCMTMEIERLRLTPEHPGDYRLTLSLHTAEQKLIEQEYAIVVK